MSAHTPPRRLVRLDEEIYQRLRPAVYHFDTDTTKLVNHILRHAIAISESGKPGIIPPFKED